MSPFRIQIIFLSVRLTIGEFSGVLPSNNCLRKILKTYIKPNETILTVNHEDFSIIKDYVTINYRFNNNNRTPTTIVLEQHRHSHNRFYLLSIPVQSKPVFNFLIDGSQINPSAVFILISTAKTIDYESILPYLKFHYIDKLAIIAGNDLHNYEKSIFRLYSNCTKLPKLFQGFYNHRKIDNISILTYDYEPFTLRYTRQGLMDRITNELMDSLGARYRLFYTDEQPIHLDTWGYSEAFRTNDRYEDMLGAAAVPVPSVVGYMEMTGHAVADCSYFTVPYEIEHKNRLNLTLVFDRYVWTVLVGCLILIGGLYYKIRRSFDKNYTRIDSIFDVVRFQLENPATGKSINRCKSIRVCVGLLLLLSLVLNGLFKGKLFDSRVTDKSRYVYDSIEDIVDKGLKIGLHEMVRKALIDSSDAYESFVARHAESCSIDPTCLNRTAFGRDYATVKFGSTVKYLLPRYYVDELGRPLVHVIDSYRFSCVAFPFYFRKGHPLFGRFDAQLGRFQQHGLVERILRDFRTSNDVALAKVHRRRQEFKFAAVTSSELRVVFLIFLVCNLLALLTFGLELVRVFG